MSYRGQRAELSCGSFCTICQKMERRQCTTCASANIHLDQCGREIIKYDLWVTTLTDRVMPLSRQIRDQSWPDEIVESKKHKTRQEIAEGLPKSTSAGVNLMELLKHSNYDLVQQPQITVKYLLQRRREPLVDKNGWEQSEKRRHCLCRWQEHLIN